MSEEKLADGVLALLANQEVERLVLAWPHVPRTGQTRRKMLWEWAKLANVRDFAPALYADLLWKTGILRADGTVHPDATRLLAVTPLARQLAAARRASRS